MTKHTPGPWAVGGTAVYAGETRVALCDVDRAALTYARVFANARLIAAAPDLLTVLKSIVDYCDDPKGSDNPQSLAVGLSQRLPAARAAIAKARMP